MKKEGLMEKYLYTNTCRIFLRVVTICTKDVIKG
jgi:hypothetical protein